MSDTVKQFLDRHVDAGTVPGAVALLGSGDTEPVTAGTLSVGGPPMPPDAIMRIQSMTKVITALAALRLVEDGRIALDDSIESWLPELAHPRVLSSPAAEMDDTVAVDKPITLRHLLTSTSGYGMMTAPSPLQRAMADNGTEAGQEPVALGADEWLRRMGELPLAFQPGEGWRYHHSFAILGVLLSRLTGRPLGDHLADDVLGPLGMRDTGYWVPEGSLDRLPAAYRHGDDGLVQTEPAGGGFYAGPPPFDVSHAELVSTAADFHRFLRMLVGGGRTDSRSMISPAHLQQMVTDQVPGRCKAPDSFFPGFWDESGWGFGVGVTTSGPRQGRYGWSGGQGTTFFVDPDGTVGILLTQVEIGDQMGRMLEEFLSVGRPPGDDPAG